MANRTLTSIEIPQADSLENVRRVVEAIASGAASRKEISEKTDISLRHIDYAIHAAKSLGFLADGEGLSVSDSGRALSATGRGTSEERDQLKIAIKADEVVSLLAPELLAETAPSKADLTKHIQEACPELSEATAARRAQTLLAWRSQALATALPVDVEAPAPKPAAPKKAPAPKKPAAKLVKKVAKKAAPKKVAKKAAKPAAKKAAKPAAKKAAKPAAKKAAKPAAKKAAPKKAAPKKAAPKKAAKAAPAPAADAPAPGDRIVELEPGAE